MDVIEDYETTSSHVSISGKCQRGQVFFRGDSAAPQPRLPVGNSFRRCSRSIVRFLKLCHDLVKVHLVRDCLAGANVFFARHGNLFAVDSPQSVRSPLHLAGAVERTEFSHFSDFARPADRFS